MPLSKENQTNQPNPNSISNAQRKRERITQRRIHILFQVEWHGEWGWKIKEIDKISEIVIWRQYVLASCPGWQVNHVGFELKTYIVLIFWWWESYREFFAIVYQFFSSLHVSNHNTHTHKYKIRKKWYKLDFTSLKCISISIQIQRIF